MSLNTGEDTRPVVWPTLVSAFPALPLTAVLKAAGRIAAAPNTLWVFALFCSAFLLYIFNEGNFKHAPIYAYLPVNYTHGLPCQWILCSKANNESFKRSLKNEAKDEMNIS